MRTTPSPVIAVEAARSIAALTVGTAVCRRFLQPPGELCAVENSAGRERRASVCVSCIVRFRTEALQSLHALNHANARWMASSTLLDVLAGDDLMVTSVPM